MPCSLPNLMSLIDGIIILILKHQLFLGSIVVSISACHAEDRGSIPRQGGHDFVFCFYLKKPLNPALHALIRKRTILSVFTLNY